MEFPLVDYKGMERSLGPVLRNIKTYRVKVGDSEDPYPEMWVNQIQSTLEQKTVIDFNSYLISGSGPAAFLYLLPHPSNPAKTPRLLNLSIPTARLFLLRLATVEFPSPI